MPGSCRPAGNRITRFSIRYHQSVRRRSARTSPRSRKQARRSEPMPRKARVTSPPPNAGARLRVGIGYDSHRFALGRPLTLGRILIPSEIGLTGHSDADAICHAITDAILGAAGLGDIGEMFPDSDPANKGRDSIGILEAAVRRLASAGYGVSQVDVSVITETPRLSPYREKIRA